MNDSIHTHSTSAPSLDTVHSVLKNRRRRFVVDVLAGREAPIDLHVLARAISMRLPAADDESVNDCSDRIATALHHVDLPKLEQADLVAYDRDERVVEPKSVERLAPFLDAADSLQ